MKSNPCIRVSIIGILTSALLTPVSASAAGLVFTAAGVLALLASDYGHSPAAGRATIVAFEAAAPGGRLARLAA